MLKVGTVLLGKYRIERSLGEGGMGVVAKAHHLHLDEPVAIKFLQPTMLTNQHVVKRFLREAQAAVKLKSEYVCRVFDVGVMDNGSPYMVMEFMDGVDLRTLATRQTLPSGVVVDLLLHACAALAEAHSLGIIHRDIKPANFFVTTRRDNTLRLKVLDFGISKAPVGDDTELTNTQAVLGTPSYMSPEQMRSSKHVDARTDIWALGVVLYELLAGHRPFQGQAFSEICLKVGMDPTPPIQAPLPDGLEVIVHRCLEKDPLKRYHNVADLAAALAPYAHTATAAASIVESASRTLGCVPASNRMHAGAGVHGRVDTASPITTLAGGAGQVAHHSARKRRTGLLAGLAVGMAIAVALAFVAFTSDSDSGGQNGTVDMRSANPIPVDTMPDASPDVVEPKVQTNPSSAGSVEQPAVGIADGTSIHDSGTASSPDETKTRPGKPVAKQTEQGRPEKKRAKSERRAKLKPKASEPSPERTSRRQPKATSREAKKDTTGKDSSDDIWGRN